jgi:hypothetical protein
MREQGSLLGDVDSDTLDRFERLIREINKRLS